MQSCLFCCWLFFVLRQVDMERNDLFELAFVEI